MTIADLVFEQVKTMPEPLAREVLDFARLLHRRGSGVEDRDLMNAQLGPLSAIWDNEDDRVWDDL